MTSSVLMIDVQGFEALARGHADPAAIIRDLSNDEDTPRQLAIIRAYCSNRVSTYRKTAYREGGFEIIETNSPDDTLVRMTLDLVEIAQAETTYQEVLLLGGTADYTSLARHAREHLLAVTVTQHGGVPPSLEVLADDLMDIERFDFDRSSGAPPTTTLPARERPSPKPLSERPSLLNRPDPAPKTEPAGGDAWPGTGTDVKAGPVLVAGSTGSSIGSGVASVRASRPETKADDPPKTDSPPASQVVKSVEPEAEPDETPPPKPKIQAEADPAKAEPAPMKTDEADAGKELEEALAASLGADLVDESEEAITPEPAPPPASMPKVESNPSLDLEAELAADIEADLVAELSVDDPMPSPASAPVMPQATAMPHTNGSANDIDEIFADLVDPSAAESTPIQPPIDAVAAIDPSTPEGLAKAADSKADAEVDQLLARLMSDDKDGSGGGGKEAQLNVVPER